MGDMDIEKALSVIEKQTPCGHYTFDTSLGDGKTWARCEECDDTFLRANLNAYRNTEEEFIDAVDLVRKTIGGDKKDGTTDQLNRIASALEDIAAGMRGRI